MKEKERLIIFDKFSIKLVWRFFFFFFLTSLTKRKEKKLLNEDDLQINLKTTFYF